MSGCLPHVPSRRTWRARSCLQRLGHMLGKIVECATCLAGVICRVGCGRAPRLLERRPDDVISSQLGSAASFHVGHQCRPARCAGSSRLNASADTVVLTVCKRAKHLAPWQEQAGAKSCSGWPWLVVLCVGPRLSTCSLAQRSQRPQLPGRHSSDLETQQRGAVSACMVSTDDPSSLDRWICSMAQCCLAQSGVLCAARTARAVLNEPATPHSEPRPDCERARGVSFVD